MSTTKTLKLRAGSDDLCVSRDLQEPLQGVLAMVELLERQTLSAEAAGYLQMLGEQARRAAQLMLDAADVRSAREGRLTLTTAPFAVREIVDHLQLRWSGMGQAPSPLISLDGDMSVGVVGDLERLKQMLDALVGLAAGRRRRAALEIAVKARLSAGRVRLCVRVRDDGSTPSAIAPLNPGAGVAPALIDALVRLMDGTVPCDCNNGPGLTFVLDIELPEASLQIEPEEPAEAPMAGVHVLIVDDNATNRLVAEAFCDMFGCTCDSAEDGLEALEAVRTRRYDVVLMDIRMPRMDGVEATRAIRALSGPERDTPIVALTANADPEDVARYRVAGMRDVVEKPIKADRLAQALEAALSDADAQAVVQAA